jgi:hypothetical protein
MCKGLVLLLLVSLLFLACAGPKQSSPPGNQPVPVPKPQVSSAVSGLAFDPLAIGSDVFGDITFSSPKASGRASQTEAHIAGYRVQLGVFLDEKTAEKTIESARSKFDEPVYLQHAPPFFRIRLGDCISVIQADSLKSLAIGLGYPDAVITDDIILAGN